MKARIYTKFLGLVWLALFSGSVMAEGLVDSLVSQLGVTEAQASGGAGAMLSMAQDSLGDSDWSSLTSYIPEATDLASGVDLSNFTGDMGTSALGDVGSMLGGADLGQLANVASAFESLGLSPDMIAQFSPVILEYLKGQGGTDLVGKLTSLWTP
ncbi:DUF2780 domain-containing protein [Ferrimonas marina]|nr:DUF2780 domain-containing protein [Ferrimonas marina]